MNANQVNTGRGYWLAWFLASIMGFGMGAILGMSFAYGLFPRDTFDATVGITFGIVMGATGGYFQWVVLRERIAGAGLWGLTSALGFGAAMGALAASGTGENNPMAAILIGSVNGITGGILQWLVLRRHIARAGWWVLANLLASLVGVLGFPAAAAIGATGNYSWGATVLGLGFGAGYGAITGAALVRLLRQSPSSDVEGLAAAH